MRFVCVLLGVAAAVRAEEKLALKYEIERLGAAAAVEVVSPGAAESRHAVRLTYGLATWSRFNWPVFRTVPGADAVSLSIRREGPSPANVMVRVVRADGVEWQSAAVAAAEPWQTIVLTARDFKVFRGADGTGAGSLSLSDVIQLQLVPQTRQTGGQGALLVDNVRLLPEGPAFTHEDAELRRLVTDPAELEFCRLNDLRARWSSELAALKAAEAGAVRWHGALARVLAAAHSGRADEALQVLKRESAAWQQPERLLPSAGEEALPLLSRAAFNQKLAAFEAGEPLRLTDYAERRTVRRYTMYRAPMQPDAEVVDHAGEKGVRQRIVFSGEDAQQVVFVTVDLPDDGVDVQGRRIFVKMRCTARGLNANLPLVMRLNTRSSDGSESWAQFKPQALPSAEWGEAVFALEAPVHNVRFNPGAVRQIAIRVENVPGKADDFVLELGPFRLGWPEPLTRVRRDELQAIDASVCAARAALFAKRAAVAKAEDDLRAYPAAHAGYWASFERPAARRAERVETLNLRGADGAGKPLSPDRIRIRTALDNGELAVEISQDVGQECELAAELRAGTGETAAAGRVKGSTLRLAVSRAALWRAGSASLYEAAVRVSRGGKTEAFARKALGLRAAEVRASGQTTVLRQAVNRRWPDWSYRWNGQGEFARFACYDMPERFPSGDDSVRTMLDSLWVDGVRLYGFTVNATACGWYDRNGIAQMASVSPSFRALSGWSGMEGFLDAYSGRCAHLNGAADSASVAVLQVGNEVELAEWGADISGAFPLAPYQPIDHLAEAVKEQGLTAAPVMYVRASRFTVIPPLPHEDVCGVNQYTGRYSGRMDEIERDLAELAIQSSFANRPLMITEWNGPKYSWASGGIGGVTTRGAAYYLERYWRGLIDTPGIVGSSEFTLNWVIAPFEDLTTQTREEAWKNRPKHSRFSDLHPADHVPQLMPRQVVQDECFAAMKAFHGPLYVMMQRPGPVTLVHGGSGKPAAERLAASLRLLGKDVRCQTDTDYEPAFSRDAGHVVALLPQGSRLRGRLEEAGVIERPDAARSAPLIQTRVHPHVADRLLVTVTADSETAFADGVGRLTDSAEELLRLRRLEGAMGRVVALTDAARSRIYERYILEQMARGYLVAGDDTRTALKEADFYRADGRRRAAWSDWAALVLDCGRALSAAELELVKRACEEGVNVVVSRACYKANAGLQAWCSAQLADAGTLAERFGVSAQLTSPIPVKDMGGAHTNVIARFAPKHAGSGALSVSRLTVAKEAAAWVVSASGAPVVAAWRRGQGHVVLFGCDFGQTAEIHWDVTHAGGTHSLYDRETACGLERVSRCVVNACLAGRLTERMRPRLYLRVVPDEVQVCGGLAAVAAADVLVCDVEGRPVAGELLARARASEDGRAAASGAFAPVQPVAPGRFRVVCAPEGKAGAANISYAPLKRPGSLWTVLSLQLKAYAEGHVPTDGAAAFIVTP